jgi:hypothetical protein
MFPGIRLLRRAGIWNGNQREHEIREDVMKGRWMNLRPIMVNVGLTEGDIRDRDIWKNFVMSEG